MGTLRIYCDYCGQKWEVYGSRDFHSKSARTCPHCGSRIDGQTWENQIVPAFCMMNDANRELMKDHAGYKHPIFTLDYEADHYFPDSAKDAEAILTDIMEILEIS